MNDITELDQLRRQVRHLMDRSAVLDCISTHSRGHDRHDVDLTNAAYHPDGVDEHGYAVTPATEYAARINQVHAAGSQVHTHTPSQRQCGRRRHPSRIRWLGVLPTK